MKFLEHVEILLVNPDQMTEAVHDQVSGLDPAADRPFGGLVTLGDLSNRMERGIAIGSARGHSSVPIARPHGLSKPV